jgi:hypothetical protein
VTPRKLAALRQALHDAEAEVARLAADVAAAEAELEREWAEARRQAAEKQAAEEALGGRVAEHFGQQFEEVELQAELEAEPRRIREESLIGWAVRELRETAAFGYVFAQVPEHLHAEVERRYEAEREAWEQEQGCRPPAAPAEPAEADLAGQARASERELAERVAVHFGEVGQ